MSIFAAFFKLGLTSFGGPVAHLGYFRNEFVHRRKWLGEQAYADLVALCQFLPGPASSQVGIGVGIAKGGFPGAFAAWTGFTLPSAVAMALFGLGVVAMGEGVGGGWLHGLKIVAVAVVAQAVWGMARSLCPDPPKATIAIVATVAVLVSATPAAQVLVIAAGGLAGLALEAPKGGGGDIDLGAGIRRSWAVGSLALFFVLLAGLPIFATLYADQALALVDSFFRSGSLVFGGGHVVLPLLQSEVVPTGWVGNDAFMAGYGAAQAAPGPLFTFAAYLGAVAGPAPNGWAGAAICLVAVFAPSFLLVVGVLPFWDRLRRLDMARRALAGVNAAVVGLLLAALYDPVLTSAIFSATDFGMAVVAFGLLVFWNVPPWLVVILSALAGAGLAAI